MLFGFTILYPRNPTESQKISVKIFEYKAEIESEHVEWWCRELTLKFNALLLSVESSSILYIVGHK
jgi:hypothetical protein